MYWRKYWTDFPGVFRSRHQEPLLLTWINLNHSMDKYLRPLWNVGWNCLFIPELQRRSRWSFGIDKLFHPTVYWAYHYLSVLRLKLIHFNKKNPHRRVNFHVYVPNINGTWTCSAFHLHIYKHTTMINHQNSEYDVCNFLFQTLFRIPILLTAQTISCKTSNGITW